MLLQSDFTYNDGNVHTVTATRLGMNSVLVIDDKESKPFKDGSQTGDFLVFKLHFGRKPLYGMKST